MITNYSLSPLKGNIKELNNVPLDANHLGAFSEDCTSVSKRFNMAKPRYSTHINLQHPKLKGNKIKPMACTFNTNVFVANMTKWKVENVTMQLMDWVMSSSRRLVCNGYRNFCAVFDNQSKS